MLFTAVSSILLLGSCLLSLVACACVPDFPERLLSDPAVLDHPSIITAFEEVQRNLTALYVDTTRDGLSFAIVHASSAIPVFTFNNGSLKNNETGLYPEKGNTVTEDSIFRVISVSKNFALSSALVVENILKNQSVSEGVVMTLDTPIRLLLPGFRLPEKDWNDGGSEITLRMLASHTAGITRESYSTGFNMVFGTGKADAATVGAGWAGASAVEVVEAIASSNLMFAPGQRAAYSNAGYALLGSAVAEHYNDLTASHLSWSQLVTRELLNPLNMTHSFLGPVPQDLLPYIGIPGGENWGDLLVGDGYDPAGGLWSSASDLAKYLHGLWLQPQPTLITRVQRRQMLKPVYAFQDDKQQVGAGWEIRTLSLPTSSNVSVPDSEKLYSIYGKSGDGGGWHSWIDVIPNLGYGIVVLSQQSGLPNFTTIAPGLIRDVVHDILAPAFAEALTARIAERYVGTYDHAQDTGLSNDQVSKPTLSTYAKIGVENQILYLRELVVNGTNALEAVDRLSWTADSEPRYFSTPQGVVLEPADGAGETAQFGPGAQVWRMTYPALETCDWFDFDGWKDTEGWPVVKFVLVEKNGTVELHYPPFDVVVSRL